MKQSTRIQSIVKGTIYSRWAVWALLALCFGTPRLMAINSVQDGRWLDGATWDGGSVPSGSDARMYNDVVLDGVAPDISYFIVYNANTFTVTNGASLTTSSSESIMGRSSSGATMNIYSGSVVIPDRFRMGFAIDDGQDATVNMYGGVLTVSDMFRLRSAGSEVNFYGGSITNVNEGFWVGVEDYSAMVAPVNPVVRQYGGTGTYLNLVIAGGLSGSGQAGEYHLYDGTVTFTGGSVYNVRVGNADESVGILILGDDTGTGSMQEAPSSDPMELVVGGDSTSKARVEGWGQVALTGNLRNNGRIIANGWGGASDRTLDLSTFTSVENTSDNLASNGWFAVNRAELVLPSIDTTGTNAWTWGDAVGETNLTLVNSLRLTLNDKTADGTLSVSLLATDRSDVTAAPNGTFIGVWDIDISDAVFGSADLKVRYDDVLADEQLAADQEAEVLLYRFTGGEWRKLSNAVVDPTSDYITVTGLTELSRFAVGVASPAGTIITIR